MDTNRSKQHYRPYTVIRCILLTILLSGCNPFAEPEPVIRIGTNVWPGYESLYLARDLGYYQESPIRLVELNSASDVIHAIRNGTLDAAALTLDEALSLLQDGIRLKLILVMDFSDGGDVLLAKPYVKSLQDLHGRRIVVENSAVGAVLLDGALQAANLSPSDIFITSCTVDEQARCYQQADAVVTFDPVKSQLLKLGAKPLFDSSQIPDRIVDVLVVLEETAQSNPESLKQLLNGYFKAQHYLTTNPDDAAKRMAPRMGIQANEVLATFDGFSIPTLQQNRKLLESNHAGIENIADDLAQLMRRKKLLRETVDTAGFAESKFLPGTQP